MHPGAYEHGTIITEAPTGRPRGPSPAGPAVPRRREPVALANAIGDLAKMVLPTKLELADSEIEDMDMQQTQLVQLKSPGSPGGPHGVSWTGPFVCEQHRSTARAQNDGDRITTLGTYPVE